MILQYHTIKNMSCCRLCCKCLSVIMNIDGDLRLSVIVKPEVYGRTIWETMLQRSRI